MWIPAVLVQNMDGLWAMQAVGTAESAVANFFRVPFESSAWGWLGGFVSHICKVTRNPRRQTAKIRTGASLAGRQEESSISVKQTNKHLTIETTWNNALILIQKCFCSTFLDLFPPMLACRMLIYPLDSLDGRSSPSQCGWAPHETACHTNTSPWYGQFQKASQCWVTTCGLLKYCLTASCTVLRLLKPHAKNLGHKFYLSILWLDVKNMSETHWEAMQVFSCWNLTFHIPHIPRRTKTGGLTISEGIFIMHWIRLNILFCFWKWWRGNAVPSDKKSLLGQQNSSIFDQLQFTCDSNLFIYESQKWMQHSSMKQFTYVLHASHKSPALNKAMRMVGIITKPNYYFCITQVDQSHPREQTNKQRLLDSHVVLC